MFRNERMTRARARVAVGAALLDRVVPEWPLLVDLNHVDIRFSDACVLSHAFRAQETEKITGFELGCSALGLITFADEVAAGFNDDASLLRPYEPRPDDLEEAWSEARRARLASCAFAPKTATRGPVEDEVAHGVS